MTSMITNSVILVVLVCLIVFSVKSSVSHFMNGGCCGSGGDSKIRAKKLKKVYSTKIVEIDGMHCTNCYTRVHNALNSIDGINAKINGSKKEAVVKLGRSIDDSTIREAVSSVGYNVISIKNV